MPAILALTPTQVNAQGLLREVQAAEEGVEAGIGTQRIELGLRLTPSPRESILLSTSLLDRLADFRFHRTSKPQ